MTRRLVSGGLGLAHQILHQPDPKKAFALVRPILKTRITDEHGYNPFPLWHSELEDATTLHTACSGASRCNQPPDHVLKPFTSDDDRQGPNAAWVWASQPVQGVWPLYLGTFDPKRKFRAWAYMMWDKERLDQLEIMQSTASEYYKHAPAIRGGRLLGDW